MAPIEPVSLLQAITLSIAVIGAILGIINTWHGLDKSRLKLKVRPAHAVPVGLSDPRVDFCISVTNLSSFAVTVEDVGFFFHGKSSRASLITPIIPDGGSWPRRLEPRSSVTLFGLRPGPADGKIKCAFAITACGVVRTGTSPALKQIAKASDNN